MGRSPDARLAASDSRAGHGPGGLWIRHDGGHCFATNELDPDAYGVGAIPLVRGFVLGHRGVTNDETKAWASEQRELDQRREFYSACLQVCFTATRPP